MYESYEDLDRTILDWLSTDGPGTPRDISERRRRENVIRVRCRELCQYGLLVKAADDTFDTTEKGEQYLKSDFDIERISKVFSPQKVTDAPLRRMEGSRLVDFSELDAEDIIYQNVQFLENSENYGRIRGDIRKTRDRINNVREGDLQRVMDEFPRNEPLVAQCAHWVRAFSGLHFFPDANHRTAMASLSALLELHGIDYPNWSEQGIRRAVVKSKLVRLLLVDVRFDNLWVKDEHYRLWHRFFRNCLFDTAETVHREYPVSDLQTVLDDARAHRRGI